MKTHIKITIATILALFIALPAMADLSIGTMDQNGNNRHLICISENNPENVHWSPDLTQITYFSNTNTDGHQEIYSYDVSQDILCQMTDYNDSYGQASSRYYDNSTIWYRFHASSGNVSEYREITFDGCNISGSSTIFSNPAWNHLGNFDLSDNFICFGVQMGSSGNTEEIFIAPIDDISSYTPITTNSLPDRSPDISFDESKIVFLRAYGAGRTNNIYITDINGSYYDQLTFEPDGSIYGPRIEYPLWSPDGSQICYSYYDGSQWDIYVINADGSNQQNITSSAEYNERAWEWQYNGILFTTDALGYLYVDHFSSCLNNNLGITIPVRCLTFTPTASMNIPITWDNPNVELMDVSVFNTACTTWTKAVNIDNVNRTAVIGLFDTGGDIIESGWDTVVAYLEFESIDPTSAECELIINYDTVFSEDPQNQLLFADTSQPSNGFVPVVDFAISEIGNYIPGDFSRNGYLNILDVTDLINYLYKGGPAAYCMDAADVNGDCSVNILDVTYIINYLYKGGPAPVCGCAGRGPVNKPVVSYQGSISTELIDEKSNIVVSSNEELMGLEMQLTAIDGDRVDITNLVDGMQIYYSQNGEDINLAILDIDGHEVLTSGEHVILEIDGRVEISSVLGSSLEAEAVNLEIIQTVKSSDLIPREFSLEQNRPNPFNPVTEISFSLPQACQVMLDLYNITGRKVATVASGQFEAGNHSVTWDASEQASGVYFYRFQAGEFEATRKMLLLK